jgi:hypothetical protein
VKGKKSEQALPQPLDVAVSFYVGQLSVVTPHEWLPSNEQTITRFGPYLLLSSS